MSGTLHRAQALSNRGRRGRKRDFRDVERLLKRLVNGTQCGSPALRDSKLCYYHVRYHWPELDALPDNNEWRKTLPTLEDANSIQVALANVMERLIMLGIDHKTAALMLYALQTASSGRQKHGKADARTRSDHTGCLPAVR
jgi:hypothetical protein